MDDRAPLRRERESIAAANHLADPSRIFSGQRLVIPAHRRPHRPRSPPRSGPAPAPRRRRASTSSAAARASRTIARQYGGAWAPSWPQTASPTRAGSSRANGSSFPAARRPPPPPHPPGHSCAHCRPDGAPRPGAPDHRSEAERQGVPRALALAVAWQESGWQQGVVSHAGAVGVMQLMPATADWIGQSMLGRPGSDPRAQAATSPGESDCFRHYLDRYDGNRDLVLAAYYQGQRGRPARRVPDDVPTSGRSDTWSGCSEAET